MPVQELEDSQEGIEVNSSGDGIVHVHVTVALTWPYMRVCFVRASLFVWMGSMLYVVVHDMIIESTSDNPYICINIYMYVYTHTHTHTHTHDYREHMTIPPLQYIYLCVCVCVCVCVCI